MSECTAISVHKQLKRGMGARNSNPSKRNDGSLGDVSTHVSLSKSFKRSYRHGKKTTQIGNVAQLLHRDVFKVAQHFYIKDSGTAFGMNAEHHFMTTKAERFTEEKLWKIEIIHFRPDIPTTAKVGRGAKQATKFVVSTDQIQFRFVNGEYREVESKGDTLRLKKPEEERGLFKKLENGEWWLVEYHLYPSADRLRSEAVDRAIKKMNDDSFSLLTNNCENLITGILLNEGGSGLCAQIDGNFTAAAAHQVAKTFQPIKKTQL